MIAPLLAMVMLSNCAWVHDDPSAGPVLAGSTGYPPVADPQAWGSRLECVELPGIEPGLYLRFYLLSCGFATSRSSSVPLVTCGFFFGS
jgi:hypothetical protein